jgi:hypothetical protein
MQRSERAQLVMSNDLPAIENLLDKTPKFVGQLLRMACECGQAGVIKMIMTSYNVDVRGNLLAHGVLSGDLGIIQLLLSYGADINAEGEGFERSPLETACYYGYNDIIKFLLENGARPNLTCLFSAVSNFSSGAAYYDTSAVEKLCSIFPPTFEILNRMLVLTCGVGRLEVAQFLVSIGASVSCEENYPLRLAAEYGFVEVVRFLCEAGADFRVDDNIPIVRAIENNHLEVVRYLVEVGADRNKIAVGSRAARYLALLERTQQKIRNRAQKKIYFWWIPICYDPNRDSGKRMMARSWEETHALLMTQ